MSKGSKSFRIAFCGLITALSVALMYGALVPAMTYALPAVSGMLIWTVNEQIDKKWAFLSYAAAAALSFVLIPELEADFFFLLFFGYYPLLRDIIERVKPKVLAYVIKLAVFNIAVVILYYIVSALFGVDRMLDGMEDFGEYALLVLWGFGNFAFICYEFCIGYLMFAYTKWLKPRFSKFVK